MTTEKIPLLILIIICVYLAYSTMQLRVMTQKINETYNYVVDLRENGITIINE